MSKVSRIIKFIVHPIYWRVLINHWLKYPHPIQSDEAHLSSVMAWLELAFQATNHRGVSAGYDLRVGWLPAYPETTGYIIETLISYYHHTGENKYLDDAIAMGDWEIEIQLSSGAVRGGIGLQEYPIVFNTGQVILGWLSLFQVTGNIKYLHSAEAAGDWLAAAQNADGSWTNFTYNKRSHAYHSRVAWPLLWLGEITQQQKYKSAGESNIKWVLAQADGDWINGMGFDDDDNTPLTHTLAYTLRGLWESAVYLDNALAQPSRDLVVRIAERIMHLYERYKHNPYAIPVILLARISQDYKSVADYSCLTGNAQIALLWLKIYAHNHDARFLNAALKLLDQVKSTQNLKIQHIGIRGAIAGSYPIWGEYMKWTYPNWAAKFFADALILKQQLLAKLNERL